MLRRTGELASIGGWELDLATMRYDWTEQVFRIHELEPGQTPRLDDAMNHYPAEGRPALLAAIEAGAREGTPWDLELPFITAKGNPRWVRAQGVAVCEDGRPVRLLGAFQDITEKKNNAARAAPAERGADAAVDDRRAHRGRQPPPVRPDAEGGVAARRAPPGGRSAC